MVHNTRLESLPCLWGQAFSLPPGFCPACRDSPKRAGSKAGGRLKA